MTERREELRRRLFALGFDDVRFVATVEPLPADPLRDWLREGMHGEMAWMERSVDKRLDPQQVLPGVKSMILLGVNYWRDPVRGAASMSAQTSAEAADGAGDGNFGATWARYALYEDYHDTMKPALVAAGRVLEELYAQGSSDYRYYVDTGPVLERGWAARAGIGFVGKNAMLISRRHGNWLFLAAILTKIDLGSDEPIRKKISNSDAPGETGIGLLCGKCTRCLDACPTQAFARPGVVDARRCISYQTIENKGVIPRELRAGIGRRIYGCDVCLEVCPWNRFAQQGRELLLVARGDLAGVSLRELLELTPARFTELFRRTPIKRLKLAGLLRNACVVAGNAGDVSLLPCLLKLATHELSMVRVHAVWAVFRLAGAARARELLEAARQRENDTTVLAEYTSEEDSSAFSPSVT